MYVAIDDGYIKSTTINAVHDHATSGQSGQETEKHAIRRRSIREIRGREFQMDAQTRNMCPVEIYLLIVDYERKP